MRAIFTLHFAWWKTFWKVRWQLIFSPFCRNIGKARKRKLHSAKRRNSPIVCLNRCCRKCTRRLWPMIPTTGLKWIKRWLMLYNNFICQSFQCWFTASVQPKLVKLQPLLVDNKKPHIYVWRAIQTAWFGFSSYTASVYFRLMHLVRIQLHAIHGAF